MLSFLPKTSNELMSEIKTRFKNRRRELKITQTNLAKREEISKSMANYYISYN